MIPFISVNSFIAVLSLAMLSSVLLAAPTNALFLPGLHTIRDVIRHRHAGNARAVFHARDDLVSTENFYKRASNKKCNSTSQKLSQKPSSEKKASSSGKSMPTTSSNSKPTTASKSTPTASSQHSGGSGSDVQVSSSQTSSGRKAGLAWALGNDPSIQNFKLPKVAYLYTWSPSLPSNAHGLDLIPMLWGPNQVAQFQAMVKPGYANIALGFNEPNQQGQSDISPGTGVSLWRQYLQPLKAQGYQLGSPATTSAPSGMTWMKAFKQECPDCHWDFVCIHYYDVNADNFIKYIENFRNTFNLPIWITEYACQNFNGGPQCSKQATIDFHKQMVSFFDETDYVGAYFPFGVMLNMQGVNPTNQLMTPQGTPSELAHIVFG